MERPRSTRHGALRSAAADLVATTRAELEHLSRLLGEVEQPAPGSAEWRKTLADACNALHHHIERERNELYSEALRRPGIRRLEALLAEAERRKSEQSATDALIFPADRFGIE